MDRCSVCRWWRGNFYCRSCEAFFCTKNGCPREAVHHPAVEVIGSIGGSPWSKPLDDLLSGHMSIEEYRALPDMPMWVSRPIWSRGEETEGPHEGPWKRWRFWWWFR